MVGCVGFLVFCFGFVSFCYVFSCVVVFWGGERVGLWEGLFVLFSGGEWGVYNTEIFTEMK